MRIGIISMLPADFQKVTKSRLLRAAEVTALIVGDVKMSRRIAAFSLTDR